ELQYARAGTSVIRQVEYFTPQAIGGGDRTGITGGAVPFDGRGSLAFDSPIVSYAWDFGDGTSASGSTASHAYAAPGTYTVTLTVVDGRGSSSSVTATITVVQPEPGAAGGRTDLIARASGGNWGNWNASISGDGRFVAFSSYEAFLVPDDTN